MLYFLVRWLILFHIISFILCAPKLPPTISIVGFVLLILCFIKTSSTHKKQLLKFLISDCKLNDKVLEYKAKAPFDKLIQCNDYKQLSNVVIEHLDEFEGVKV